MKLLKGLEETSILPERVFATIGNFDGVHRGHQALLASLRAEAARLQCPVLVVLFEPQPNEYFRAHLAPARLTSLSEKLKIFSLLGVDYVCCLTFNTELTEMSAAEFAEHVLFNQLKVKYLLTGRDFRFGKDRLGDVELLTTLGKNVGTVVEVSPDFMMDTQRISSTGIRQALHQGDLSYAAACLGRPYSLSGQVIQGDGRGRQWGIPTANIALSQTKLPLSGVFSVEVMRPQFQDSYHGVANIGHRPTVDGAHRITLEVHLFDFDGFIYGEILDIRFVHKLRDEVKFNSVGELIDQIHRDIAMARTTLSSM